MHRHARAFTLLEVVVAVGIFAIGIIAAIGLFTPVARSVGEAADGEAASRLPDLVRVRLQTLGIDAVAPRLKVRTGAAAHELTTADGSGVYDVARDPQILFASRDGTKIGDYADPIWIDPAIRQNSDREKYFEIALVRNETLSPRDPASDALAPVLAYTARVRWPSFGAPIPRGPCRLIRGRSGCCSLRAPLHDEPESSWRRPT
jgi:prepilin-type N-terminal cleavage/methylation domain-containing protein